MRRTADRLTCVIALLWFALLLAAPVAADDSTRTVAGTVASRLRLALPSDAVVIVEARDKNGKLLGSAKLDSAGRELPLPFTLRVPPGVEATLRAGIRVAGRPGFVSDSVVLAAGAGPAADIELVVKPYSQMGFASQLGCGDTRVTIGFVDRNAVLEAGGERFVLAPVASSSGRRFEAAGDPGTFYRHGGGKPVVSIRGKRLAQCVDLEALQRQTLRARGNEPGWNLEIANRRIVLVTKAGAERRQAALPLPLIEAGAIVYRVEDLNATVRIAEALCRDSATGMPYPRTVTVATAQRTLSGCGGEPIDLLTGARWTVTEVLGARVDERAQVALGFARNGQAYATTGCNPVRMSFTLTGEGLKFTPPPAGGRKACIESHSAQESRFLAAMQTVVRFDIDAGGNLRLIDVNEAAAIVARRMP